MSSRDGVPRRQLVDVPAALCESRRRSFDSGELIRRDPVGTSGWEPCGTAYDVTTDWICPGGASPVCSTGSVWASWARSPVAYLVAEPAKCI